jgi:hypothetical protein
MNRRRHSYDYRIAFGAWINDMRLEALPLENWPAPQMDAATVKGLTAALDTQARFGYTHLDVWGLFATKSWPLNLGQGIDKARRRRVKQIIQVAHDRGIKLIYGMGTYSWGYEKIIENDPSLAATNRDGTKQGRALCDANPKSFELVKSVLDFVLSGFDFDGVHLESFDLGGCFCPHCAGKAGIVEYHSRINRKTADCIRARWPDKLINVIPISWANDTDGRFTESDKDIIVELSKHIDGFYDQGWRGTYVAPDERADFIKKLSCVYGTSGGRWMYPCQRWDRGSFFVPHAKHQAAAIKEQFGQGVRGLMHYQGPVNNPGTEFNIACGGLISSDTSRSIEEVAAQVVEDLYRPKTHSAHSKLVGIFLKGEDAYFDQWGDAEETEKRWRERLNCRPAGEFYIDGLVGGSPGPAGFIANPVFMDAAGRLAYKNALVPLLRDLQEIECSFRAGGRIRALRRSITITLTLLNTAMYAKGEPMV